MFFKYTKLFSQKKCLKIVRVNITVSKSDQRDNNYHLRSSMKRERNFTGLFTL